MSDTTVPVVANDSIHSCSYFCTRPACIEEQRARLYEYVNGLQDRCHRLESALTQIAAPMRPDGTYNRDREACRQLAAEALEVPK